MMVARLAQCGVVRICDHKLKKNEENVLSWTLLIMLVAVCVCRLFALHNTKKY